MLDKGYPPATKKGTANAIGELHRALGMGPGNNHASVMNRLNTAVAIGIEVRDWTSPLNQEAEATIRRRYGVPEAGPGASPAPLPPPENEIGTQLPPCVTGSSGGATPSPSSASINDIVKKVVPTLRNKPASLEQLAEKLGLPPVAAAMALSMAIEAGATVVERGGLWHLDDAPPLGIQRPGERLKFETDKDGYFEFAACSDEHLCSKYERLDCLHDYYDQIQHRGITTVFNAGNWVDGEASFNRHDLKVHGMDEQINYLVKNYPHRKDVNIYAVTGADHEGWYARREGIDVGRYAQNAMREAGREDWHDLGYMEAMVDIVHPSSGKSSKMCIMHPGGGSSYAVSYAPQKIVEGFDGGDKPAVLLIGHYHKSGYNTIRNCHTMQTGTFMGQSVFMRQKKLSAHLGGCFVKIHVDPRTGAVDECSYTFRNYFNVDYYNGQWSQHGPAVQSPRSWQAKV